MMLTLNESTNESLSWTEISVFAANLFPLFLLFLINNYLLLPRLLLRNKYTAYVCSIAVTIAVIWGGQILQFFYLNNPILNHRPEMHPPMPYESMPPHEPPHHKPHHILPMPVVVNFINDLLVIGTNIAVALIFQRIRDRFEQNNLINANIREQLQYLKAQINPHFYMNMLNNIHGMIEIDAEKAQEMVINLSKLMRYMLYESANERIELSSEIRFLDIYLQIMHQRYPEDKVTIETSLPSPNESAGVMIAPLLFLVFIENSFKHGISYKENSYVKVTIRVEGDMVKFYCVNSIPKSPQDPHKEGIGLQNVQRRLNLIYGNKAKLNFIKTPDTYTVTLTIPAHETSHSNN
ncbi:MAG: histidine kinase [Barnesiella sp.]|nr:histidine kinase [Barnesiella sp.]